MKAEESWKIKPMDSVETAFGGHVAVCYILEIRYPFFVLATSKAYAKGKRRIIEKHYRTLRHTKHKAIIHAIDKPLPIWLTLDTQANKKTREIFLD